jgi:hypothetical protein
MGINYSFELIFESKQINLILGDLGFLLCKRDARRLAEAMPWEPEIQEELLWGSGELQKFYGGIGKLRLKEEKFPNNYCFTFLFPIDTELKAYAVRNFTLEREDNKIPVSCIWTSLFVDSEYGLLHCEAATSDMSYLFSLSQSIKDTWISFASRSRSLALFFDTEENYERLLLYPEIRKTMKPYVDCFYSPDFRMIRADSYCSEALFLSKLV